MTEFQGPSVELFVRPARPRMTPAPSLLGQQWAMVFGRLQEMNLLHFEIIPTAFDRPPENYTKLNASRTLPVACVYAREGESQNLTINSVEGLETFMTMLKQPNLAPDVSIEEFNAAEKVCEDLYKNMMNFIRNDMERPFLNNLSELNDYLSKHAGPYMLGDKMSYIDCQLMPRLQHIRVAGHAYKKFDIPYDLLHLWKYIKLMYSSSVFRDSCPTDADMLQRYEEKHLLPKGVRPVMFGSRVLDAIPDEVTSNLAQGEGQKSEVPVEEQQSEAPMVDDRNHNNGDTLQENRNGLEDSVEDVQNGVAPEKEEPINEQ